LPNAAGLRFEGHPQVLTVRYEDLVREYEAVLARICDFLGEPFHPAFLSYPDSATVKESGAWFGPARSLDQRSLERWRRLEHVHIVGRLLEIPDASKLLKHYRYEL
jgi:hypothetical protein